MNRTILATSLGLLVFAAISCLGSWRNEVVSIGQRAPAWKDLDGVGDRVGDGVGDRAQSLADLKDAKVVVLTFTCTHCPVALAYEERFKAFQKEYKDKGIQFVAIDVTPLSADELEKEKIKVRKKGFNYPYLFDPSQKIGRAYGATVTPHLFVLDKDRNIAYMGAFDDDLNSPKTDYVKDAVEQLLAGKKPTLTESQQVGCGIQYTRD